MNCLRNSSCTLRWEIDTGVKQRMLCKGSLSLLSAGCAENSKIKSLRKEDNKMFLILCIY